VTLHALSPKPRHMLATAVHMRASHRAGRTIVCAVVLNCIPSVMSFLPYTTLTTTRGYYFSSGSGPIFKPLKSRRALNRGYAGRSCWPGRGVRHTASALEPDSFRSVTRIPDDVPDLTSRFGRTKSVGTIVGPGGPCGRPLCGDSEAMSPHPPPAARARSEASALEIALR